MRFTDGQWQIGWQEFRQIPDWRPGTLGMGW
jgi:hypothetical protein